MGRASEFFEENISEESDPETYNLYGGLWKMADELGAVHDKMNKLSEMADEWFDSRPRLRISLGFVGQRVFIPCAGSSDSLSPDSSVAAATFVYVARLPPAPFPPPPFFVCPRASQFADGCSQVPTR
jgi:hypothetical protein